MIRTLNDLNIKTKHPIVVTNWSNEEGTRFAPAMLSSGVFAGVHSEDWAKSRVDANGKSFGDELERIGWVGDEIVGSRQMRAMFELHIEQGPILEAESGYWRCNARPGIELDTGNNRWKRRPYRFNPDAYAQKRRPWHGKNSRIGRCDCFRSWSSRRRRSRAHRCLPKFSKCDPRQSSIHRGFSIS